MSLDKILVSSHEFMSEVMIFRSFKISFQNLAFY